MFISQRFHLENICMFFFGSCLHIEVRLQKKKKKIERKTKKERKKRENGYVLIQLPYSTGKKPYRNLDMFIREERMKIYSS